MPRIKEQFDSDPHRMPFEFADILATISPRSIFVSAPTRDDNFPVLGVKECIRDANLRVSTLRDKSGSERWLKVVHPECGHEFPEAVRKRAYEFIESGTGDGDES